MSGGAIKMKGATATFTNSIFLYNYASEGGVISGEAISSIDLISIATWEYNYAFTNGGVLHFSGSSKVSINMSTFANNTSKKQGSVLYFLGTDSSTITDSSFINNTAIDGNTIMLLFANTEFSNIIFIDNYSNNDGAGLFITFSEVSIVSSKFSTEKYGSSSLNLLEVAKSTKNFGLFLSISAGAEVTVTSTTFSDGYAQSGGFIYISGNSILNIADCSFSNSIVQNEGGAIYASGFKYLGITNSNFSTNTASKGKMIYLSSGSTNITSTNFTISANPTAITIISGEFSASQIVVKNTDTNSTNYNGDYYGGAIYATNMLSFTLTDSTFANINYAEKGGAVYLTMVKALLETNLTEPRYWISSWNFTSNSALYGGAVYINNIDYVKFSNTIFDSNQAVVLSKKGGQGEALYYESTSKFCAFIRIFLLTL